MHDQLRVQRQIARVKSFHVAYAKAIEHGIRVEFFGGIGAGDHRPTGMQHLGKSRHSRALDADQMNAKARQCFREKT